MERSERSELMLPPLRTIEDAQEWVFNAMMSFPHITLERSVVEFLALHIMIAYSAGEAAGIRKVGEALGFEKGACHG